MLWMETYFLYCSVRLGIMVISIMSLLSLLIPCILFLAIGLKVLEPTLKFFTDGKHFRKHFVVKTFVDMVKNDPTKLIVVFQLYFVIHMAASIMAFYGALKLKKYFLVPQIVLEFLRVIYCLAFHILLMIVAKNHLNLGLLITSTLAGGFLILFLGYNWGACVAMYQIITLINTERYKSLYGDDPFKPLLPKTYNPFIMQDIRVLITPNNNDIDEQKKSNAILRKTYKSRLDQPQSIISVLPVKYLENNVNTSTNNTKKKNNPWPITTVQSQYIAERYAPKTIYESLKRHNNSHEINYSNWQWSELAPVISARNKKNIFVRSNWNY